ncbi:hypothetical protein ISR92_00600 [Patescibacteria group bacterium]|nr:hypothetical protein [Patescibacteria group bacterium]
MSNLSYNQKDAVNTSGGVAWLIGFLVTFFIAKPDGNSFEGTMTFMFAGLVGAIMAIVVMTIATLFISYRNTQTKKLLKSLLEN